MGETATFTVEITLSTEEGELPTDGQVLRMVHEQMGGDLDEDTGLRCLGVWLISRTA